MYLVSSYISLSLTLESFLSFASFIFCPSCLPYRTFLVSRYFLPLSHTILQAGRVPVGAAATQHNLNDLIVIHSIPLQQRNLGVLDKNQYGHILLNNLIWIFEWEEKGHWCLSVLVFHLQVNTQHCAKQEIHSPTCAMFLSLVLTPCLAQKTAGWQ